MVFKRSQNLTILATFARNIVGDTVQKELNLVTLVSIELLYSNYLDCVTFLANLLCYITTVRLPCPTQYSVIAQQCYQNNRK